VIQRPTTYILLLLGIRVFREPKLPMTRNKMIVGAITVVNGDITPISLLYLHLPLPMESTLFLLLSSRTTPVRVNHVAVEEAQEAPDVVIGMILINDTSAVVLFDSRVSHFFISAAYVGKHNLSLALLRCQMIVSSLGGDMPARQL
jgi:hypothetical protein